MTELLKNEKTDLTNELFEAANFSGILMTDIKEDGNTSPMLRLFWCGTLALIPLCMNFIGAPLNTLQTITIITSLPFIVVIICMTQGNQFLKMQKQVDRCIIQEWNRISLQNTLKK